MSRSGALRPNTPIYYTSIKQREHKKCCQLYFEARLTSVASLLGVLTQPFYLLSKPDSPFAFFGLQNYVLHPRITKIAQRYCFFFEYASKNVFFLFFIAIRFRELRFSIAIRFRELRFSIAIRFRELRFSIAIRFRPFGSSGGGLRCRSVR